jgi:hypothetical protein
LKIYLKERIGNPELFTGRKKELAYFLNWVDRTKKEISRSTAILSRRKTGKTALLQRLYNLTFHNNNGVIPFYFEIRENSQWLGKFAEDFFLAFVYQYVAFKTRNTEYLSFTKPKTLKQAFEICKKEGLDYLTDLISGMQTRYREENADTMWDIARDAPRGLAEYTEQPVVQMIDEFQFINRYICRDKACKNPVSDLAGSYLHTSEYRHAPLLVTGSWVGWLMDDLNRLLPGRFIKYPLENMPQDEAIETVCKYSLIEEVPITEESAFLIAQLTEGNPFYISALFGSRYPEKDLSSAEGVRKTLEFETLSLDANINATWMEYLDAAFSRINDVYAKDMVLYLSKNRDRYVSRRELKEKLNLDMTDTELEKKFKALLRADIIEEDYGRYRGLQDNVFDKIFRRSYSDDIDKFLTQEAPQEYKALFEDMQEKYRRLSGEYNRYKGAFAEFVIWYHLTNMAFKNKELYKSMMKNIPDDFEFAEYKRVWSYLSPPLHEPEFQIDVFARAGDADYALIGEVKNRKAKFSVKEAGEFMNKAEELVKLEGIQKSLLFVFSANGFHKNTLKFMKKHKIAWSSDKRWLEF